MTDDTARPSPLFPVATKALSLPENVPVQYIGRKPEYKDRLYKSGLTFLPGQIRTVPRDLASRFLRHLDMFALVAGPTEEPVTEPAAVDDTQAILDQTEKDQGKKDDKQNQLQDLYDQVNFVLDKDSLELFARANYQVELDKRKRVDTLRKEVITLIDQYGAPGIV